MRRESRRKQEEGFEIKKVFYVTGSILALAVIAFVITFFVYGNKVDKTTKLGKVGNSVTTDYSNTSSEATSSSFGKTVNEVKNSNNTTKNNTTNDTQKIAINTSNSANKNNTSNNTTAKTTDKTAETKKEEKVPDPTFKMPVTGEFMKEFAQNKLVYSSTLDLWTTHNGVDIKADKTSVVKASAEGTVKSIKNDPRYGLTVTIEHVNGYKTVYANLLSTEFVVEGEKVKQGQSIGTVGTTATFEISDEAHLHFELLKNNEQQDPELYLK